MLLLSSWEALLLLNIINSKDNLSRLQYNVKKYIMYY